MRISGKSAQIISVLRQIPIADLAKNAFTLGGFCLLLGLITCQGVGAIGPFPNVFLPSIVVIVGSLIFLGSQAFTITRLDYVFVLWFTLAYASHIYATMILDRSMRPGVLDGVVFFILAMYLFYRAVFSLILVSPKIGSRLYIAILVAFLTGAAVLGLLQRYGPGAGTALAIGSALSAAPTDVAMSSQGDRTSGVFAGPNVLGYANSVLVCLVLGWAMAGIGRIGPWKTFSVMFICGLAFLSVLASQSRSTLLALPLCPLFFGYLLVRFARDRRAVFVFGMLCVFGLLGMGFVLQRSRSTYLEGISHTGLTHDFSYEDRVRALGQLEQFAYAIAPFGAAVSEANNPYGAHLTGFGYYNTVEVDNEWANSYEAFGVWGPLWLCVLGLTFFQLIRAGFNDQHEEYRALARIAMWICIFLVIFSAGSVRIFKNDTAGFIFSVFAALAAWDTIHRGSVLKAEPAQITAAVGAT